jgi:DNA-binding Xre family transcriptional regulator
MAVSYNKLWKLLIDRKMKKKDLVALSGVSKSTIAKMVNDEHVSTEMILKICTALNCDVGDVMEIIHSDNI